MFACEDHVMLANKMEWGDKDGTWTGMLGAGQAPVALPASQGFALDSAGGSAGLGSNDGHKRFLLLHHWPQECCQHLGCLGRDLVSGAKQNVWCAAMGTHAMPPLP